MLYIYLYTYRKDVFPNKIKYSRPLKCHDKNLQQEKEASLSYLQMNLAILYLPIKILSTLFIFNNGKTADQRVIWIFMSFLLKHNSSFFFFFFYNFTINSL